MMASQQYPPGRSAGKPADDLSTWLLYDMHAHPRYQVLFERFGQELATRTRAAMRADPTLTAQAAFESAFQAILSTVVVSRPMGRTLANLLREVELAFQRVVDHSLPRGASARRRHEHGVALVQIVNSPHVQARPLAWVLDRLLRAVASRARKEQWIVEPHRAAKRLRYPGDVPVEQPPAPDPDRAVSDRERIDMAEVELLCRRARLRPKEATAFRAECTLWNLDPLHEPQPADIALRLGLDSKAASILKVHLSRAHAKLGPLLKVGGGR